MGAAREIGAEGMLNPARRLEDRPYRVMGRWLKGVYPVSTGLVVDALARPEWLVEIDATAVISQPADRS